MDYAKIICELQINKIGVKSVNCNTCGFESKAAKRYKDSHESSPPAEREYFLEHIQKMEQDPSHKFYMVSIYKKAHYVGNVITHDDGEALARNIGHLYPASQEDNKLIDQVINDGLLGCTCEFDSCE